MECLVENCIHIVSGGVRLHHAGLLHRHPLPAHPLRRHEGTPCTVNNNTKKERGMIFEQCIHIDKRAVQNLVFKPFTEGKKEKGGGGKEGGRRKGWNSRRKRRREGE
jgi:hypothetical protein